jgi:hypothetical protein
MTRPGYTTTTTTTTTTTNNNNNHNQQLNRLRPHQNTIFTPSRLWLNGISAREVNLAIGNPLEMKVLIGKLSIYKRL